MSNIYLGKNIEHFKRTPVMEIDRVILYTGESNNDQALTYYAPQVTDEEWDSMTGKIIVATVPFGNQTIANSLLQQLSAIPFRPYNAQCTELDLAAELGDWVTANGVYSFIAKETIHMDNIGSTDVSADDDWTAQDKFPYMVSSGGGQGSGLIWRLLNLVNQSVSNIVHAFALITGLDERVRALEERNTNG